jgi:hypothetical protein
VVLRILLEWLEKLLLLFVKSLQVSGAVLVVLSWSCDHILFELRRKLSLNLFYIDGVIRVIIVVADPLVEHVELLFLWILALENLLVIYLSRENLGSHPDIFLVIWLDYKTLARCRWLESRARRIKAISTVD